MYTFLLWVWRFLLAIPTTVYAAFVMTQLWVWFLVPLGVPAIGMAHAYGLVLLAGFFYLGAAVSLVNVEQAVVDQEKTFLTVFLDKVIMAATVSLLWGFGAIAHNLM